MSVPFRPIGEVWPSAGACRCPDYWECGDYCTMARPGSKPGKLRVACAYHAQRIEASERKAEQQRAIEPREVRS